jgi:hypothetical protein
MIESSAPINDSKRSEFSPRHLKFTFQRLIKKVFWWGLCTDIDDSPSMLVTETRNTRPPVSNPIM